MFITIIILLFLLNTCHRQAPCPPGQTITIVKHDTVRPVDKLQPIVVKVPEAYKATAIVDLPKKIKKDVEPFLIDPETNQDKRETKPSPCDTIRFYSDTTYKEGILHAVVNDTVQGKLLGYSLWFADLKPTINTTVTNIQKERVKVYLGGSILYNIPHPERWGIEANMLIAAPKGFAIEAGYDFHNQVPRIGGLVLIRFKR